MKNLSDEEFEVLAQAWATVYCCLSSCEASYEDTLTLKILSILRKKNYYWYVSNSAELGTQIHRVKIECEKNHCVKSNQGKQGLLGSNVPCISAGRGEVVWDD